MNNYLRNEPFKEERSDEQLASPLRDTNELADPSQRVTVRVQERPEINEWLRAEAEKNGMVIDPSKIYSPWSLTVGPENTREARQLAVRLRGEVDAQKKRAVEEQGQHAEVPDLGIDELDMPDGSTMILFGTRRLFSLTEAAAMLRKSVERGSDPEQAAQGLKRLQDGAKHEGEVIWAHTLWQVQADLEAEDSNITMTVKQPEQEVDIPAEVASLSAARYKSNPALHGLEYDLPLGVSYTVIVPNEEDGPLVKDGKPRITNV